MPRESKNLVETYPYCSLFLNVSEDSNVLLRGDSCPFLIKDGKCALHGTQEKPVICTTYPLIFWKISKEMSLVWIYPCRGDGFRWNAKKSLRMTDDEIYKHYNGIKGFFNVYWGESVDKNNPYGDISEERVRRELTFFDKSSNGNLINRMYGQIQEIKVGSFFTGFDIEKKLDNDLINTVDAVLHWLCWSPTGLSLTYENSKTIFSLASSEIIKYYQNISLDRDSALKSDRFLQQIGSFLSTAILPSFWEQISGRAANMRLKKFSNRIIKVLSGELAQQELLQ
ncbi:MAG: hypothetical protein ACTSP4_13930 [Candidatus Hodarchaeales archaeon]